MVSACFPEMRILVVEDTGAVRRAIVRVLEVQGYAVEGAGTGEDGLARLAAGGVDAVILDVNLPGIDGFAVCRELRARGDRTPVLMLTARDTVGDRVAGLDAGADDYVVKPFVLPELLARVRALLRRTVVMENGAAGDAALRVGDIELDLVGMSASRGGRPLELTRTELLLLELFLRNPRQVLSRDQILDAVWGPETRTSQNGVEVYVGYLRRKLEEDGEPRVLQTVRGFGYALREQA
jgi:two-component system, OmpR family, response regulator MprA